MKKGTKKAAKVEVVETVVNETPIQETVVTATTDSVKVETRGRKVDPNSPSHNIHGMPLACLLGHGDPRLTGIAPAGAKLSPADVCLIGVRSFEAAEAALLSQLGVRVYFMDEVRQRGLHEVFAEALRRVGLDTAGYGISIDLDALDPAEGPGVGTPVGGGLARAELAAALALADGDERLLALEIVEYNPYRDEGFATARAIHDLCRSLIEI